MFNNRTLAVAAVLALAVPALGAAAPIYQPPQSEQLVEGHTVFTLIEVDYKTADNQARFAAAVAVLVREYKANSARFPGVLWFNDQYLVNPTDYGYPVYRYPCGGAVLAVNHGSPDPRVIVASANVYNAGAPASPFSQGGNVGSGPGNDLYTGATSYAGGDSTTAYGSGDEYNNDYAWVNASVDRNDPTSASVLSDGVYRTNPTGTNYQESYYIVDPNDHHWIIDKYQAYTRTGVANGGVVGPNMATGTVTFPVWVVNTLGSPLFIPDDGISTCSPFYDVLLDEIYSQQPIQDLERDPTVGGYGFGTGLTYPRRDDPPGGYKEPSDNGYCYNGNAATDTDGDGNVDCGTRPNSPVRLYNALLYFKLEDLNVNLSAPYKDHTVSGTDTNGCEAGTEWACPLDANGVEDDNAEGNSHPFHPAPGQQGNPSHTDTGPCYYDANKSNHGGSENLTVPHSQYSYDYGCSHSHAVRFVDIYFDGAGRPAPPLTRSYNVQDTEGSTAPFHCWPNGSGGNPQCPEHN